jgi:hypothetical protein
MPKFPLKTLISPLSQDHHFQLKFVFIVRHKTANMGGDA